MINIGNNLKRSWHILWNYRILWIFGILAVLTGAGVSGGDNLRYTFGGNRGNTGTSGYNPNFQPGQYLTQLTNWYNQNLRPLLEHPDQHMATILWIGAAFLLFLIILGAIAAIIRYVSDDCLPCAWWTSTNRAEQSWFSNKAGRWAGTGAPSACG